MPLYETVFIARNDVTQQQVEAIADAIGTQLDADKGIAPPPPPAEGEAAEGPRPSVSVKKREYWGLRSLAYRIKKNRKGHYMLLGIDAAPASVLEMERQLRLNEDVLRFMTIRVEAIEEAPERHPVAQVRRPRARLPRAQARRAVRIRPQARLRRPRGIPRARRRRAARSRRIPHARGVTADVRQQRNQSRRPPRRRRRAPARSTAAASPARSPARTRRRSTTRTCACCRASCPSAARSCPAASPRSPPRSSASWPTRSSAPASSPCCPTS